MPALASGCANCGSVPNAHLVLASRFTWSIQVQHFLQGCRNRHAGLLALIILMAGCRNPAENGDPRACQQTYEFGNTGCFEVAGQVVGARGQALSGISVVVHPIPGPSQLFNSPYQTTDTTGQFRIRPSRMFGRPPLDASPDTLSVWVHATDPRSAPVGKPLVSDSVRTLVTVAPVGVIPVRVEIRIILPVP